MKRINNVYDDIISIDNLRIAHKNAKRGKSRQKGVREFEKDVDSNLMEMHATLASCAYKSPKYATFTILEPKERKIFVLPYPHRIIQHAILQKIGDMFVRNFTRDTYSCIKGRGIYACKNAVHKAMEDKNATLYTLKMDVAKFYPSVDHDILKALLLRKIKDAQLLKLLFEIIDGNDIGLPIGSYISQFLGNFIMSGADHYIKEQLKVKHYFRYCDDLIFFGSCKKELHRIRFEVQQYLWKELKLKVNRKYQVFPTSDRGLDFLGYRFYHHKTLLRKSIKKRYAKMLRYRKNKKSIASYNGWLKWADCINLNRTLLFQHS